MTPKIKSWTVVGQWHQEIIVFMPLLAGQRPNHRLSFPLRKVNFRTHEIRISFCGLNKRPILYNNNKKMFTMTLNSYFHYFVIFWFFISKSISRIHICICITHMHTHTHKTHPSKISIKMKRKRSHMLTFACDLSTWEAQDRVPSLRSSQPRSLHRETLSQNAKMKQTKKVLDKE